MSASFVIIVPTYQERNNLPELWNSIRNSQPTAHLLIVDDASGDGTPAWVQSQPEFNHSLFLIERPHKQGLGRAYLDGFRWAIEKGYDFLFEMDADLSHDPAAISLFLEQLHQQADLVLGSRYRDGVRVINWPISRLLLSLGAAWYVRLFTRMPFTDPTSGYKAVRISSLKQINLHQIESNGYGFQIEVTHRFWRKKMKIAEVPIIFEGRHHGESKMSSGIAREAFWLVIKLIFRS
ncbi:MAG: polyprenol monophosphomannose synthase [Verrucomicrobiota bacterium]